MKNNSLKFQVSTFDNIWDTNNEDQSKTMTLNKSWTL